MNIDNFKSQIEPATAWFFDPATETTLIGIEFRDLRIETGYTSPDVRAPKEVILDWHKSLISSIQAGKPGVEEICTDKRFFTLLFRAEELLKEKLEAARLRTVTLPSLHSRRRLVNLAVKGLRAWPEGGSELTRAIYENGPSTLNEPVIDLAQKLIPEFRYNGGKSDDDKAAQQYDTAQRLIKQFCAAHGTKPVIFDVIARKEHLAKAAATA